MSHLINIIADCKAKGSIEVLYNSLIPIYFDSEHELKIWARQNHLDCSYRTKYQVWSFRLAQTRAIQPPLA